MRLLHILPRRARLFLSLLKRAYLLPEKQLQQLAENGFGGMHGELFRFYEDGLASIHNCDFLRDPRFQQAYAAGHKTGSWKDWALHWRAYVICWAAEWASHLPGDFVECGVNRGGFARMILQYVDLSTKHKRVFLFDTFDGLSPLHLLPEENSLLAKYDYTPCLADVTETFRPFSFVSIIPGTVPETLASDDTEQVSFLSIDMNCVSPEIAAIEHFWPKIVPSGVIVLDDYEFSAHIAQKLAFDHFARNHNVSILSLPTGQGLIFKP